MIKKRIFYTIVASLFVVCAISNNVFAQADHKAYTLQQLFEIADSNSTEIKSRILAIKEAEAGTDIAKNALFPEINVSVGGSLNGNAWMSDRDFSNGVSLSAPRWGNTASVSLVQPLYTGGAISGNIKMQKLKQDLTELDLQQTKQTIRFLICGFYLDIYRINNLIAVCESNIARTKQVIEDMKAKQEAGTVLENDITRYEVQLQNLNYRKTELASQTDILNYQLITLLNLPVTTKIAPDTTLLELSLQNFSVEEFTKLCNVFSAVAFKKSETDRNSTNSTQNNEICIYTKYQFNSRRSSWYANNI